MKLIRFSSAVGCLLICTWALTAARASELFVSPSGNDSDPGTKNKPLASLEGARDAVRKLKQSGGLPKDGITIWVRQGVYLRERSFVLSAGDSGTAASPVQYRAYNNETVRLVGGQIVKNFKPVADSTFLNRLNEAARTHVLEADLQAMGISNFGQLRSRGFGRPTAPAHMELFFAGNPMTLARWPNEGEWAKITGFPDADAQGDEHGGRLGGLTQGFRYAGDLPAQWRPSNDIWVHGYWAWDWANSYERVSSLDASQHLVKTAAPHGHYGFREGQRFYFVNVLEELDQAGEYFVDREAGRLFFWPPKLIDSGEAVVSLLESPLITVNNAAHVMFQGFILEETRGLGVHITGGSNITVAGCAVRQIGSTGIEIDGGHAHRITGCNIENTGDSGVSMSGGDRKTLSPGGHVVENCHFQKQGRWSKCYVPAIQISGVGLRASHNLIHDHPHCAILFGGNDHVIEFNEIHHVALETGDVGAIYAGRDYSYRGNVIRHNFIHHTGGVGMGSMGVYMDDCVSGTEIIGNVFYKVSRAAFLGGGRDHRVENNIFVDCQPAVELDGRGLDKSPVWHNMVYQFMKQRLQEVPQDLYRKRYPAIATLDPYYIGEPGIPPEGNVVAHNISVGGKWLSIIWHADPKQQDVRDNYVGADPGFIAPEEMDFRLKSDSPVFKLGFKEVPFKQIGLRDDVFRREPSVR